MREKKHERKKEVGDKETRKQ